jgi:hypothetical protein
MGADLDGVRAGHPLGAVLPLLRSTLVSIADEAVHVMIVTDADGTILWREGAHSLLRAADSVGLAPGMRWSEDAIGTNAMGTALAVDEPVQIHSAEHLVRTVHSWTCAAAPILDPVNGMLLGAIDISGPCTARGDGALVAATAQLAENQLRVRLAIADEQLRIRNMPHLASLRGLPGALVTPTGRILAGEPYTGWPVRVRIEPGADRVRLDDGREMAVEPLAGASCCTRRNGPPPPPAAGRCRCGSSGTTRPCCSTAHPSRSPSGPPSCSPRSPCTPTG